MKFIFLITEKSVPSSLATFNTKRQVKPIKWIWKSRVRTIYSWELNKGFSSKLTGSYHVQGVLKCS